MTVEISKNRIMEILTDLVAFNSISCTELETEAASYVYDFIKSIPYFQKHPELFGKHEIEHDHLNRFVPFALVRGNRADTVIVSGHVDVVSVDGYGEAEELAFTVGEELENKLASMDLDSTARADLESGEWIWGRGVADMKGGMAIALCLLEKYAELAEEGKLEGTFFFTAVADEESYSAGMRAIMPLLGDFKEKYDLKYKLLINPEPAAIVSGSQVLSLGTVGKVMPCIVTQGVLAHLGRSYNGISALNMLSGLFNKINGSLQFVETYEDESTTPPIWLQMRDCSDHYDVSLPFRGQGYFSLLTFSTPIEELLDDIKKLACEVFEEEVEKLNNSYQEFKKINKLEKKEKIYYPSCVMTIEELTTKLRQKHGKDFDKFFGMIYKKAEIKIAEGDSYPDVTCAFMGELLDYADIKTPVILIGLAPPYYPPTHSDQVEGANGFGTKVFNFASKLSSERFGQELISENYFTGISDNSYTSISKMNFGKIKSNLPLWGSIYNIDFDAIQNVSVPSILYGPVGIDYHQWTERVNKRSLLEVTSNMIQEVIHYAWDL